MNRTELLPGEQILKTIKGDCWQTPNRIFTNQVPGTYIFTNQRIIFQGNGIIEKLRLNFDIPYKEISSIEPYLVVFFPTGIRVYLKNGTHYRMSVMKRKECMELINRYL